MILIRVHGEIDLGQSVNCFAEMGFLCYFFAIKWKSAMQPACCNVILKENGINLKIDR
jgi:hypothetical protein